MHVSLATIFSQGEWLGATAGIEQSSSSDLSLTSDAIHRSSKRLSIFTDHRRDDRFPLQFMIYIFQGSQIDSRSVASTVAHILHGGS